MNTSPTTSPTTTATLWWNDGHALRTRLFDALSLMLPCGEQFLLDTTTEWLSTDQVTPACKNQHRLAVTRFMAEERAHQRAHRQYNQRLQTAGLPVEQLDARIQKAVDMLATWSLAERLAIACAFEHLTAVFSREVLRDGPWLTPHSTLESRLWRWHCAEEVAHSDVVFELLPGAAVPRRHKLVAVIAAVLYLTSDALSLTWALCLHDVRQGKVSRTRLATQALGLAWRGLPSLLRMAAGTAHVVFRAARSRPA